MSKIKIILSIAIVSWFFACDDSENASDAYGNFEAKEYFVSSEIPGKLIYYGVQEGEYIKKGDTVAVIDTVLLNRQKDFLNASINAAKSKKQNAQPEIDVISEQKKHLQSERARLVKLLAGNAATQKQIDDLDAKIRVLDKQKIAIKSKVNDINRSINSSIKPFKMQLEQINEKISKSIITNTIDGQVLFSFKNQGEIVNIGMPLYKIANLEVMELKAYISGDQLPHVKLGQQVKVLIDENKQDNRALEGVVSWISGEAEFTPKTIQTKEERVNQVYAIKVKVKNDGSIKIGMPGEVVFD